MNERMVYERHVTHAIRSASQSIETDQPMYLAVTAWMQLQDLLASAAWINTSSSFKQQVVNQLHELQGRYLHRASRSSSIDLYLQFFDIGGVTWRQLSDIDVQFDGVGVHSPELDTTLERLGNVVKSSVIGFNNRSESSETDVSVDHLMRTLHYFRSDTDAKRLRGEIGGRPRPYRSLTEVGFARARSIATHGVDATVCFSASENGTDVVVLTSSDTEFRHYPLFTTKWLSRAIRSIETRDDRLGFESFLRGLLQSIWYEFVSEVVAIAKEHNPDAVEPRIIWCPSGLWQMLPITAAGDYSDPMADELQGRSLLFSTVSTVVPTPLSVPWITGGHDLDRDATILSVVAEKTSLVDGLPVLQESKRVLSGVRLACQRIGLSTTHLDDKSTDGAEVLKAAADHDVLQIHCHGGILRGHLEPSLLLHSDAIGWEDLAMCRLRRTKLALLTACGTAQPAASRVSDGHSIAQAFFERGVPLVVSSQWSIDSVIGRRLTECFYDALERAYAQSGRANLLQVVHTALRGLVLRQDIDKVRFLHKPEYWAPLLVMGG